MERLQEKIDELLESFGEQFNFNELKECFLRDDTVPDYNKDSDAPGDKEEDQAGNNIGGDIGMYKVEFGCTNECCCIS